MKRRAAIEPAIGHLKDGHRLNRNRFKGEKGDRINAVMSAMGMNFLKLLRYMEATFLRLFYPHLLSLLELSQPLNLQPSME